MGMMTRRNVKARIPEVEVRAVEAAPAPTKEKESAKVQEKEEPTKEVTKEEVEKMPYFGLKSLAAKYDIDTEGKKAAKLREEIIDKLNL